MVETATIRELLNWAEKEFDVVSESPRLDGELLLCHCLGKDRSFLFTWPDKELTSEQKSCFENLVGRRLEPQPVAYLLGQREFYSLTLKTTPATLVPRPETELLVDTALELIKDISQPRLLDLGTGTGAIPLSIKHQRPDADLLATDVSEEALGVAKTNSTELGLDVDFRLSDWFDSLDHEIDGPFELIISNPPYIAEQDPYLEQGDLPAEPRLALTSGQMGMDAITQIVKDATDFLKPEGWLLLEHGYEQGEAVRELMEERFAQVETLQDFNGLDRVTLGQIKP